MGSHLSGSELLRIKKLMGQIIWQYYNSNEIVTRSELEEKYKTLMESSKQFNHVELTKNEEREINKLNLYAKLFEEYHITNNVVRKAEIEEIFTNLTSER